MKALYDLKDKLCAELDEIAAKNTGLALVLLLSCRLLLLRQ